MPPPPPPPPPLPPQYFYNPHTLEANGQHQKKTEIPPLTAFLNVVNIVTQLFIGAVAFCGFSIANIYGYANTLSQHVYLCVLGYVILMSQAILTFNYNTEWSYTLNSGRIRVDKRTLHATMQTLGSILAIVGSVIRIADMDEHFHTAHSVTGIIALVLTLLSLIGGVLNFIYYADNGKMGTVHFKVTHACIGSLTISVAFICLCLGFRDYYNYRFGVTNENLAISLTVFALAGLLTSTFFRIVQRLNGSLK